MDVNRRLVIECWKETVSQIWLIWIVIFLCYICLWFLIYFSCTWAIRCCLFSKCLFFICWKKHYHVMYGSAFVIWNKKLLTGFYLWFHALVVGSVFGNVQKILKWRLVYNWLSPFSILSCWIYLEEFFLCYSLFINIFFLLVILC